MASFRRPATLQVEILALRPSTPRSATVVKRGRSCLLLIDSLGLAVLHLERMAVRYLRRQSSDGDWLVSQGLSTVLELEGAPWQVKPPLVPQDVRELIRTINRENPIWGAPGIHGEPFKLRIDIGETSVSKYMVRRRRPPSQTNSYWTTALRVQ